RTNRRLGPACNDRVDAAANDPVRMGERVQAACALGHDDRARSFDAVFDGDLASARRVEPRDRLIRADEPWPFAPETLNFALAELVATARARRDDADSIGIDGGRIQRGILQRK